MLNIKPGQHGSTYGGNPVACRAAIEALKVIDDEGLVENSAKMGDLFLCKLRTLPKEIVSTVRGRGLFIAIVISENRRSVRYHLQDASASRSGTKVDSPFREADVY
ncbi:hypothetical protein GCK32_000677 [Trichostrongylus colubriformis]|uniref:Ornithine aminotransferase n=1 Tax=Trichostrongylus colubriformis TaxID=6319 RepID=A0AAN8G2Z1_TRICO